MAIKYNDKLCMKVVEKFTENLGTETGNLFGFPFKYDKNTE